MIGVFSNSLEFSDEIIILFTRKKKLIKLDFSITIIFTYMYVKMDWVLLLISTMMSFY
jgi:hypothetical protein